MTLGKEFWLDRPDEADLDLERDWVKALTEKPGSNAHKCVIYLWNYPHFGYIKPLNSFPGHAVFYIPTEVWPLKSPGSYDITDEEMTLIGRLNIGLDNDTVNNNLGATKIKTFGEFGVIAYNFNNSVEKGIMITNHFPSPEPVSLLSIPQGRLVRGFVKEFMDQTGMCIEPVGLSQLRTLIKDPRLY